MKPREWHKRYKQCLINQGVTKRFAQKCLDAGMGEYDYDDEPEEAAISEMSYWEE